MSVDLLGIGGGAACGVAPLVVDVVHRGLRREYEAAVATYFSIPRITDTLSDQKNMGWAKACETLPRYVELGPDSHLQVTTNNFEKWTKSERWQNYLVSVLTAGTKITAFGRTIVDTAVPLLKRLADTGKLEVVTNENIGWQHWTMVDKKPQVWFESYHKGDIAWGCTFTGRPSATLMSLLCEHFANLRRGGKVYQAGSARVQP